MDRALRRAPLQIRVRDPKLVAGTERLTHREEHGLRGAEIRSGANPHGERTQQRGEVLGYAPRHAGLEDASEVIEGVAETLAYLNARHRLTLCTKGHTEEQLLKFNRSALGEHFHGVKVVREKNTDAYREIVEAEGMDPARTWMIGNSPKSDIHPALEAGLGAVLVPHERTWRLELTDLPDESERFRIVERFVELQRLF